MKITYTAPNRSHHYPYAEAIHKQNSLYAFVSGFSRFSPRSPLPVIGNKMYRYDFFQNLYLASLRFKMPDRVSFLLNRASNMYLDYSSYEFAKRSDAFIYYRTQGYNTTKRIHKEGINTLCIMEEVNSHVDNYLNILNEELLHIGYKYSKEVLPDYSLRLKSYYEADLILCPSEFVRKSFISAGFDEKKIIKVNYGFTPPTVKEEIGNINKNFNFFRILYVGQINYRKGLRYAIEAFKKIKHPNKEFVIVGPKTKITGLEDINIPKEVIFTGALKGKYLIEQYKKANVFVLPSIEEGLALVQGEAMTFGLPIIITTNTGGSDIIKDGREGFIVPPCDTNALAEKFQKLIDEPHLLAEMSYESVTSSKKLGNWDIAAQNLLCQLKGYIGT